MDSTCGSVAQYNIDYPTLLESSFARHHSYLQEQITFLYFNITRKNNDAEIQLLTYELHNVLYFIKQNITELQDYLTILCKLVCQTRSTYNNGKGEHELSYMLLYILYQYFPEQAIHIVLLFVGSYSSLDSNCDTSIHNTTYGSWRDIKYLCEYIRLHSMDGENDPFITECIHIMNTQLKRDLESWKFSINAFSREHISSVSKWIPRENKKFSWLYEKLVVHWAKQYVPHILRTAVLEDSYIRAIYKCKRIYRKITSLLNKGLNTVEIKQCSRKLDEILPNRVSAITCMKQKRTFLHGVQENNGAVVCSQNFRQFYDEKYNKKQLMHRQINITTESFDNKLSESANPSVVSLPLAYFAKEAMRLLALKSADYEIDILNKQWTQLSQIYKRNLRDTMIPIINVSQSMQENQSDCYYSALGYAIMISQYSLYKYRILAYDYNPTWINLSSTDNTFVSMVDYFQQVILCSNNTVPNLEAAFDLLVQSFHETNSSPDIISDMTLVILSDSWNSHMTGDSNSQKFVDSERPILYQNITNKFSLFGISPVLVFWNLSKTFITESPVQYNQSRCVLLSGQSSSLLHCFYLLQQIKCTREPTPYDLIISILNQY